MKNFIVSLLGFIFILTGTAMGANYYCSPTGTMSDSGGSDSTPWASLKEVFLAGKTFNAGDTIFLMSGNHGFPVVSGINSADVIITRYKNDDPMVNGINFKGATHWVLDNIKVSTKASPPANPPLIHPVYPIMENSLVQLTHSCSYITLSNCYIYSIENSFAWTTNDWNYKAWNGIQIEGNCSNTSIISCHIKNVNFALELSGTNYATVKNTLVENFCGDGIIPGNNCLVEGNIIRDSYTTNGNHCDLVQAFWTSNLQFRGNTLIARTANHSPIATECQGIGFFDGPFNNCVVENNVVVVETYHGITIYNAQNCKIVNNTLIKMANTDMYAWITITGSGNLVRNNICPLLSTIEGTSDHNLQVSRAKYSSYFVDPDNQNYHLKAGSPAIDAGIDTGAPVIDLDSIARPQYGAHDVGAYEYEAGPDILAPVLPVNLVSKNITSTGFTVSWKASTDNVHVAGYDIYLDGILKTTVATATGTFNDLTASTAYVVTVKAKDAAGNTSPESIALNVVTLDSSTGVENAPSDAEQIIVYPNPVEGSEFYISSGNLNGLVTVQVFDSTGKMVLRKTTNVSFGRLIMQNTFKRGFYIIEISNNQTIVSRKLFIK